MEAQGGASREQALKFAKLQTQRLEQCKKELQKAQAQLLAVNGTESEVAQVLREKTEENSKLNDKAKALFRKYKDLKRRLEENDSVVSEGQRQLEEEKAHREKERKEQEEVQHLLSAQVEQLKEMLRESQDNTAAEELQLQLEEQKNLVEQHKSVLTESEAKWKVEKETLEERLQQSESNASKDNVDDSSEAYKSILLENKAKWEEEKEELEERLRQSESKSKADVGLDRILAEKEALWKEEKEELENRLRESKSRVNDKNDVFENGGKQENSAELLGRIALSEVKESLLVEMAEYSAVESVRALDRVAKLEQRCVELERKGMELSKKFSQKYKVAKSLLQKETNAHSETKSSLAQLQLQIESTSFNEEREELCGKIKALESGLREMAEASEEASGRAASLEKELLVSQESVHNTEQALEALGLELSRVKDELEQEKRERSDLESESAETRAKLSSLSEQEAESKAAPVGFRVESHVLCTVTVRDTLWVCVDKGSLHSWVPESQVDKWLGRSASGLLPVPLEMQFQQQSVREVESAKSETASVLAEVEKLRGQLAQYKRRAQIALKKAQEEAGEALSDKVEEQEGLISQLQTEVVKLTTIRDTQRNEIEELQKQNANLQVASQSRDSERQQLEADIVGLKESLEQQSVRLTMKFESEHERALSEEREEYSKQRAYWKEREESSRKRADGLSVELESLHDALEAEKTKQLSLTATIEELQSKITLLETDAEKAKQEVKRVSVKATTAAPRNEESSKPSDERELAQPQQTDMYSIPLFFDSMRKQQEQERVVWQKERMDTMDALKQSERVKEQLEVEVARLGNLLSEERRKLQRQESLVGGSSKTEAMTYLKNVVVKFAAAKEVSEKKTLLPVLVTVLQLSQQEQQDLTQALEASESTSWLSPLGFS